MTVGPLLRSPRVWHYASLVIGLLVITSLQLSQWFYFDEWSFIELDGPGLFEPHVGHWSTSPLLVYRALGALVGEHSYLPYALLVTIIHLAIAHLAWRLTLRSGAAPWIATAAVAVLIFLGTGAENILWAFQIGYLGATALGLLALWLATAERLSWPRLAVVTAIAIVSLSWSGTAIPLVVATAIVLLHRHGWRRTLVFVLSAGAVYLAWYALFAIGSPSNPDTGGLSLHKLFVEMPTFLGILLVLGFGDVFPLIGLGAVLALAATVWGIVLIARRRLPATALPAVALAVAALVFALLSAYSRAGFSVGAALSSRYAYTVFLLLLPLLALALTTLAQRHRWGLRIAVVAVLLLAGYQAAVLVVAADEQSALETESHRRISAALSLYVEYGDSINPETRPDWQRAPDLSMGDLGALYDAGRIDIGEFSEADLASVRHDLLLDD